MDIPDASGPGAYRPATEYIREVQAQTVEELALLPEDATIADVLADYSVMRTRAKAGISQDLYLRACLPCTGWKRSAWRKCRSAKAIHLARGGSQDTS